MNVFIVGASGLIGSHCLRYFRQCGWHVQGAHYHCPTAETVYFDALSPNIARTFEQMKFHPDILIHCGALTNVDYCELYPQESQRATLATTIQISDYCSKQGIKLVYLSTDYVFDGSSGPYSEDKIPNPINVYGQHKLSAEQVVAKLDNCLTVRITNVYGEDMQSRNFVARLITSLKSNEAKEIACAYDQFATPIYAGDISKMLYLLIRDNKSGIYHLSSTDYYSRYQLACKVQSYFPKVKTVQIRAVPTKLLNQAAPRPLKGGLLHHKFISEYPDFILMNADAFVSRMTS